MHWECTWEKGFVVVEMLKWKRYPTPDPYKRGVNTGKGDDTVTLNSEDGLFAYTNHMSLIIG